MHIVSQDYKKAMNKPLRDRGFIQVGIGVVAQEAQGSAKVDNELAYWSTPANLFNSTQGLQNYYATLEENYVKADARMLFMPEDKENYFYENGITTVDVLGSIKISFDAVYPLKGLTLDFGKYYPTEFTVTTSNGDVFSYTQEHGKFATTDNFGEISYLIITPIKMYGGVQRMRLFSALMGVGLTYGNDDIANSTYTEFISLISEEVSSNEFEVTILDPNNIYNVDSDDTFINFLQTGQKVTISEGIQLEDGSVEWIQLANLNLDEWSSVKGEMTIKAVDKFAQMDDEYSLGDKIYTRTAYEEAESILQDMGFEPDEYELDDYLQDITFVNPMPTGTHKECLQLLANACRCVCFQDYTGKIIVRSSFELVVDPTELDVSDNGHADWSKPQNVKLGTDIHYADLTQNFVPANGKFYFVPENGEALLESGYVSAEISNEQGLFSTNPQLIIQFPSATTYYGVNLKFGGNTPRKMIIHTYFNNLPVDTVEFDDLEPTSILFHDFDVFDKMVFEFTQGYPNNRIVVDAVSFGNFNDYELTKQNCFTDVYGIKETKTKSVSVKIYTFENDDKGNPKQVEDDIWYKDDLNTQGQNVYVENPLISTEEMAKSLAEWLGLYYNNNTEYEVDYRGEPRLNANDVIHLESDFANNLQVAITEHTLTFNGAFGGSLVMRKAMTQKVTS